MRTLSFDLCPIYISTNILGALSAGPLFLLTCFLLFQTNESLSHTVTAGQDREKFERLRWVELKHGRIAMLAVVGKSREKERGASMHVVIYFPPTTDMT